MRRRLEGLPACGAALDGFALVFFFSGDLLCVFLSGFDGH